LWATSTKLILANPEVERVVNSAMNDSVNRFLEEHPKLAEAIVRKGVSAARSRAGREKA
jgi:DNA gyrase subunit B